MDSAGKILLVTRNLPPLIGGMERLIHHAYRELVRQFTVAVVGPEGCAEFLNGAHHVTTCKLQPVHSFLACIQWKALRLARKLHPDLILSGSGVAAPAALLAARLSGAPVICYLHGLDLIASSPFYRALFLPAIRRCDLLIVNSHNTAMLAKTRGVPAPRIEVLYPGVTLPESIDTKSDELFRKKIQAEGRTILLSVGRLLPRKGLVEFATRVLPTLVKKHRNLLWVIIGTEPAHALKASSGIGERIMSVVAESGVQNHVRLLGGVDDSLLRQAFYESDLFVFPVLDLPGDVEGFGMVAVEAAAHGLPTVAFAAGGVPDAVKDGVSGYLVRPGDYAGFSEVILRYLEEKNRDRWSVNCRAFAQNYSWDRFGERLRRICVDVIQARHGDARR